MISSKGEAPDYVNETFGMSGLVKCCKGRQCGHGAVYLDTWPPVTQVRQGYILTLLTSTVVISGL